ncbi:MAG: S41 family peptidase [Verrucomicrobiales bacterium]
MISCLNSLRPLLPKAQSPPGRLKRPLATRKATFPATLLFIAGFAHSIHAEAPRVIQTVPKDGARSVAASLSEITVTFNQAMDQSGYSFTGGGESFPKLNGQPRWQSARECVLRVQLQPSHDYVIGLNSATHRGFRNTQGELLAPSLIRFRTSADVNKSSPAVSPIGPIQELRQAIENHYSYLDVHGVEWPAQWKTFEPKLSKASSPRHFAEIAGQMLAATKDIHIWLTVSDELFPAHRPNVTPNANPELLPKLVQGWKQPHRMVWSGMAANAIGYLAIHSWERQHQPELLAAIEGELDRLTKHPALIIDLRLNSGGDERLAQQIAARFDVEPGVYAKHRHHGSPSMTERTLTASTRPYTGKVAVLMGPANMSSCEAFLLMMKRVKRCQLIGASSFGASGNPKPHSLSNGVTVYLPSWQAFLPDGSPLELVGVAPDIGVPAGNLRRDDAVLQRAVQYLTP